MEKSKRKEEIISWIKAIAFGVAVYIVLNNFIIVNAEIPSSSMENIVMKGDRVLAFRPAYLLKNPQRGDIVVFKYPDDEEVWYIKRVIGVPGDVIEIKEGKVYLNGEAQQEDYIKEEMYDWASWGPYTVPENSYFMMGDNRNYSEDSRYWKNTYVKKEKILGKAVLKYYPNIEIVE